ncbi:carbohydrate ABC transporter membrane protein 2 (CUT1 family) [Scopulibacillus darangshiensis]|uniref:Carbohydrate ABC transporter membrane protein 2 (CUT1 family) n=1 Tax=Scopulibacillus darangshiensis TaxID=442528 RepID=A0A4R2P4H2_9BACL|nr:carbohydrate ABC transporter permease [Scopulibacillus darangshiensis]TCP29643.1 carbohydrate ABC transporter membrane protein 2 (CUT1 family) [Scopulibacillus darangshiensis]
MELPRKNYPFSFKKTLNYTLLTAAGILFIVPLLWMAATSLKPSNEIFTMPPKWFGSHVEWTNYFKAWDYFPFLRFYINTIIVSLSTVVLVLLTSSLAAYAFARMRFKGRDMLFLLYLGTLMIPGQVTIVPLFILMKYLGWVDTYQALILPGAFSAFGTFLLRQFFLTIPVELEEAARIDGCSRFGLYWRILLPLSGPGLAALGIFTFIGQWNNFLWPLIITNTDSMKTLPLGIAMFQSQSGTQWHLMMAASSIAIIPTLIVFICAQKYFIKGITMTGMGGR